MDSNKELTLIDLIVIQNTISLTPKLFYEPIKSIPAIVADKNSLYVVSDEYSLGKYSEKQRENWVGSDITICENEAQLRDFIRQAREGKIIVEPLPRSLMQKPPIQRPKRPAVQAPLFNNIVNFPSSIASHFSHYCPIKIKKH